MKKTSLFILALILVSIPFSAKAFTVKSEDTISIPAEEIIEDNLYAAAQNITIDGTIQGDLICASNNVTVNGNIEGDLICAAENITVNGTIQGSARLAAKQIKINGEITRNANLFALDIYLNENAKVARDLFVLGSTGDLRGTVGADLHGLLEKATIAGNIERNIFLQLNDMEGTSQKPILVEESANIGGNLNYTSFETGQIINTEKIQGEINHSIPKKQEKNVTILAAWLDLFSIFSALVVGLVLITFFPKKVNSFLHALRENTGKKIGMGALILFLTPIICFLLFFTIIGIPLSVMVFVLWIILNYITKILIGIFVGNKLIQKINPKKKVKLFWAMIFGVLISWTIFSIPVFGWTLSLIAICWGLGTMLEIYKENK